MASNTRGSNKIHRSRVDKMYVCIRNERKKKKKREWGECAFPFWLGWPHVHVWQGNVQPFFFPIYFIDVRWCRSLTHMLNHVFTNIYASTMLHAYEPSACCVCDENKCISIMLMMAYARRVSLMRYWTTRQTHFLVKLCKNVIVVNSWVRA